MTWPLAIVLTTIWLLPLSSFISTAATTFGFIMSFTFAVSATALLAFLYPVTG